MPYNMQVPFNGRFWWENLRRFHKEVRLGREPPWAVFLCLYRRTPKGKIKKMFMLGKKMKMTQIWKDDKLVPVTLISAEPNKVAIVRTADKDGYQAYQLQLGRTKREFRTEKYKDVVSLNAGDTLDVSAFKEGDKVHIRGTMKGRGFQGTVHRYNFGGGPKTHGQKNRHRAPGSIGSTAPQRVWPGRRMAGHMGTTIVTVKN